MEETRVTLAFTGDVFDRSMWKWLSLEKNCRGGGIALAA